MTDASTEGSRHEDKEEEEEEEYPSHSVSDDFEEEDVYVMVELPSGVDPEVLTTTTPTIKGIGTSHPEMTIGDEVLEGKMEPILGTVIAFQTPTAGAAGSKPLELMCFSTMRVRFEQRQQQDDPKRKKTKR